MASNDVGGDSVRVAARRAPVPRFSGAASWLHASVLSLAMGLIGLTVIGGLGLILRASVLVSVAAVACAVWLVTQRWEIDAERENDIELGRL